MLEEGSAPMTAHESGAETVLLRREVGGDEGKDIQRDTVDGCEGVLQFADGYRCIRDIPFGLRNGVHGKATMTSSGQRVVLQRPRVRVQRKTRCMPQPLAESKDKLRR